MSNARDYHNLLQEGVTISPYNAPDGCDFEENDFLSAVNDGDIDAMNDYLIETDEDGVLVFDINEVCDESNIGALYIAVHNNDIDMVEELLTHADLNVNVAAEASDTGGSVTPLELAIMMKHFEIVERLLTRNDLQIYFPFLVETVENPEYTEIVKLLLSSPNIISIDQLSLDYLYGIIIHNKDTEIFKLVLGNPILYNERMNNGILKQIQKYYPDPKSEVRLTFVLTLAKYGKLPPMEIAKRAYTSKSKFGKKLISEIHSAAWKRRRAAVLAHATLNKPKPRSNNRKRTRTRTRKL
jgi:ankyrin repeat protein